MANGIRFNVIVRQIAAMRCLDDAERRVAIDPAPNVIGFERFAPFAARVGAVEIDQAVSR